MISQILKIAIARARGVLVKDGAESSAAAHAITRALGAKISASRAKVGKEDDQGWKTPSLQSNRARKCLQR